jgi:hypothetical protein
VHISTHHTHPLLRVYLILVENLLLQQYPNEMYMKDATEAVIFDVLIVIVFVMLVNELS